MRKVCSVSFCLLGDITRSLMSIDFIEKNSIELNLTQIENKTKNFSIQ